MRGLFTAGVLDFFLDQGVEFPYIIGVSAGVCHGVSYVSKQRGRSCKINIDNAGDKRYVSFRNLIRSGSMFGMDYIFDDIPNRLYPFDFKTFSDSPAEFVAGVTDIHTGNPVYFGKEKKKDINLIARASSAIPVFSPIVEYGGGQYLDGGTSDPIPVRRALNDGCDGAVIVLTRDRGFVRQPEKFRGVYRRMYRTLPAMVRCLDERYIVYNETLAYVRTLEKQGKAFVIAPPEPVTIGRFERDREKLQMLYQEGYDEASRRYGKLQAFLHLS